MPIDHNGTKDRVGPLIMTLLVRDEADIVRQNIEFHLSRGVDHIFATDNGSADGTSDIFDEYQRAGPLTLLREPSDEYRQMAWVDRMIKLAIETVGECWLLNNDADEFWRPPDKSEGRSGNLRDLLMRAPSPSVVCRRHNMVNTPGRLDPEKWSETLVWRSTIKTTPPKRTELLRTGPMAHPFYCFKLPSKVLVYSRDLVSVNRGCHSAAFTMPVTPVDLGVEIFHYPLRSAAEFKTSVVHISRAILKNTDLGPIELSKYRRWGEILNRTGSAEKVVEDALPTWLQLQRYRLSGRLVKDQRMRDDLEPLSGALSNPSSRRSA